MIMAAKDKLAVEAEDIPVPAKQKRLIKQLCISMGMMPSLPVKIRLVD
jgi:pyruvate kinase